MKAIDLDSRWIVLGLGMLGWVMAATPVQA